MNKVLRLMHWVLLSLLALLPVGTMICLCFGYTFQIFNTTAYTVIIALWSISTVILDCVLHYESDKATQMISTVVKSTEYPIT